MVQTFSTFPKEPKVWFKLQLGFKAILHPNHAAHALSPPNPISVNLFVGEIQTRLPALAFAIANGMSLLVEERCSSTSQTQAGSLVRFHIGLVFISPCGKEKEFYFSSPPLVCLDCKPSGASSPCLWLNICPISSPKGHLSRVTVLQITTMNFQDYSWGHCAWNIYFQECLFEFWNNWIPGASFALAFGRRSRGWVCWHASLCKLATTLLLGLIPCQLQGVKNLNVFSKGAFCWRRLAKQLFNLNKPSVCFPNDDWASKIQWELCVVSDKPLINFEGQF